MAQYKVQISLPPSVMQQVDAYCKSQQLTRSGFFTVCATSYLTAHRMADAMEQLVRVVSDAVAASAGDGVSPEQLEQLDRISQLVQMIQSGMR